MDGAELAYGFKENISKEKFERRIKDNTLTDVCNFVPVNKGDVLFIDASTLHVIGEGIRIAEVQQNSNIAVCDKFSAKLLNLNEPMDIYSADSFVSLIVIDGNAILKWNDEEINIKNGDSIFVLANLKTELRGNAENLYSYI